jgi:integrase
MPANRKKEQIACQYFRWLLGTRDGVYTADGRSNPTDGGRHSLGTRDRAEAIKRLSELDKVQAVELGLADRAILAGDEPERLNLDEGRRLYREHVQRPPVLGGTTAGTWKRYRAVLDKFIPFAQREGIHYWQMVSKRLLESYGAWLDDEDYGPATEYLELTTLKQVMKWLAEEGRIPKACLFALPLKKPQGTTTYCYRREEVEAMVAHCRGSKELTWLADVIIALACTGLRIGELAGLRWSDLDLESKTIRLTDERHRVARTKRAAARSTKSHRDRSLPIHDHLQAVLKDLPRHADGRVFHGPKRGVLKPDTIRNILEREVLTPLAERFPTQDGEPGIQDGRLHSLRHFFCSVAANSGVPEQVVMTWLGHRDSKMVRHYYHLFQDEAQRQMARIDVLSNPSTRDRTKKAKQPNRKAGVRSKGARSELSVAADLANRSAQRKPARVNRNP